MFNIYIKIKLNHLKKIFVNENAKNKVKSKI